MEEAEGPVMNHAFQRLLRRIDDELNQTVLPHAALVAKSHAARLLAVADQDRLAALVFSAPIERKGPQA